MEEDVGKLRVVLQRGPVAYGRASVLCYPQSLDAELGLDYIFTAGVNITTYSNHTDNSYSMDLLVK